MRNQDEACNIMENNMNSVARNDNDLLPNDNSIELITIENNYIFVQIRGLSDNEQLNALRRSKGIAIISQGNKKAPYDKHGEMFPDLFPFGRGHPGEERLVQVSVL